MAQKRPYSVNWEPYREEIIDYYVTQKNTALRDDMDCGFRTSL